MADGSRRFLPPWRADKIPGGYVVRDANGQALAYVYSRGSEVEALQAKVLTKDQARRIAVNIARLPPELLGKADRGSESETQQEPLHEGVPATSRLNLSAVFSCRRRAAATRR
jgi:hypothetical protein